MTQPLLEVANLKKHFPVSSGMFHKSTGLIKAVDGISFTVGQGDTLALVGESGCGKTTTGRLILRLIERTGGGLRFYLDGNLVDLGGLEGEELRTFRRYIQLIFQDPFSSLNPRMTVFDAMAEPLRAQSFGGKKEIESRVKEIAESVGLPVASLHRYPHAFSGGQRQRVCIARALALSPRLVVCDEPVSSLDVSVQAQILNLLKDLQEQSGLSYLFIAHDLAVVENISHRIAVMYAGRIVEMAPTSELFSHPRHPYTEALMDSVPVPVPRGKASRPIPPGEVADPSNLPPGCAFHPRCRYAEERCSVEIPDLREMGEGRLCACHFAERIELRGVGKL